MLTLISQIDVGSADPVAPPGGYAMRPCERADIDALGTLSFAAYDPGVACATIEAATADIRASFDGEYGEFREAASPVAVHGGEIVAAVMTVRRAPWDDVPGCPFIIELFTDRDHRRRGLGRSLIATCRAAVYEAGERAVALRVDPGNAAARSLYAALGFEARPGG